MRILVNLYSNNKNIVLPVGYLEYMQALIYNILPLDKSSWLHSQGYTLDNYKYKFFNFSWILQRPKFKKDKKLFIFPDNISFIISSPIDFLLEDIATSFIKKDIFYLGKNSLFIKGIEVLKSPDFSADLLHVKTITPIELHTSIKTNENKTKTYYYTPYEQKFFLLLKENILKKWKALYKKDYKEEKEFSIQLDKNLPIKQQILYFGVKKESRIVVKAWYLSLFIKADSDLLSFIYYTGLGSRNSQGLGLIDIYH